MLTIDQQIHELRAELAHCALTRKERAAAKLELENLIARKSLIDAKHESVKWSPSLQAQRLQLEA